jgi:DNA mismatch endonuclease (patch repair protein)
MTRPKRSDPIAATTTKRMVATRGRDNPRERALRSTLHKRGLRFRLHRRLLTNSRRTVDVVFLRARVAVFLDGCFWHGCPSHGTWPKNNADWWREKIETNIARDRDTDRRLEELGWTVVRVWEHEPIEAAADRLGHVLRDVHAQTVNTRP